MKSWSTKNWFSSNFAFIEQEKVGQFFFGQYPDDRVEKEYISIFLDKCTAMFVMGVWQGNAKKNFQKSAC